ncbi:hypothetical protein LX81_02147 [Palleronia aestuarii]|uniref:AAA+ family ATPase n=1 Tax=Palleronia aestuarii TaxID=568105 RepID=A0A2W7N7E2_9RHOB|nr:AAA+ family ATPase [Palleronia aestuarii]PZX16295.1 hypothetical protein LX81_02147 [Palleronia aestuarii]
MKRFAPLLLGALLSLSPAYAQQTGEPDDIRNGLDQLGEGARTLLRGLMGTVDPEMRKLADALEAWDFEGLDIDDLGRYHPPEVLPNGDILIRRKTPRDTPMDGEIDL